MSKKYNDSISSKMIAGIIIIVIVIIIVGVVSYSYYKESMKTTTTLTTNSSLQPQTITVVMYSGGRANFLNKTVIPMFEKEYPNIKVNLIA